MMLMSWSRHDDGHALLSSHGCRLGMPDYQAALCGSTAPIAGDLVMVACHSTLYVHCGEARRAETLGYR
jgi:hypothetical protein